MPSVLAQYVVGSSELVVGSAHHIHLLGTAMASHWADQPPRLGDEVKRLAWTWRMLGKSQREFSKLMSRSEATISTLFSTDEPHQQGRPSIFSKQEVEKILRALEAMVDTAEGTYEVTALMLKKKCQLSCSVRTSVVCIATITTSAFFVGSPLRGSRVPNRESVPRGGCCGSGGGLHRADT